MIFCFNTVMCLFSSAHDQVAEKIRQFLRLDELEGTSVTTDDDSDSNEVLDEPLLYPKIHLADDSVDDNNEVTCEASTAERSIAAAPPPTADDVPMGSQDPPQNSESSSSDEGFEKIEESEFATGDSVTAANGGEKQK